MSRFVKNLNLILVLSILLPSIAFTQDNFRRWSPENGIAVRQGWHTEWFRSGASRIEGELAGEVALVWADCRSGDYGIYMQVIDTDGELKFGENGILVADTTRAQVNPVVCACSDGGWFVAWEDFSENFSVEIDGSIHCTKINSRGERLWGENQRGVPVCAVQHCRSDDIRVLEDSNNGCFIIWRDGRRGDMGDIYGMHVTGDGVMDRNWEENGIPIVRAVGGQRQQNLCSDGDGGMIVCWQDGRDDDDYNVWVQRVTEEGELLWGDGIIVCNNREYQELPKICSDRSGGAFVVWVNYRDFGRSNKDIYTQRVNSDGELLYGDEGAVICGVDEEQHIAQIVISNEGSAIVCWEDKRNDRDTYDIYVMRISGEEELVREWEPEACVPVVVAERNQMQVSISPDGNGGAYIVWEDERERPFPELDIWTQRLNSDGDPVWDENGIPVCAGDGCQSSPVIYLTDRSCTFVWGDSRTGGGGIYAQQFSPEGRRLWEDDCLAFEDSISGNANSLKLMPRDDGSFVLVWLDGRRGGLGSLPYIQYCRDADDQMEIELENDGIPVFTGTIGGSDQPDAVSVKRGMSSSFGGIVE
ncbi:MAG: hypothetical protein P9X24_00575 [Candidatus Hatepunaea meridiana]|nr:hypothetical protein [Candidatus Hatepunaea meridiana]